MANLLDYFDYPTVPMVITADANGRLSSEYQYDKIAPEIRSEIVKDYYIGSVMRDMDLSTIEKLARVIFITESTKISNYEYAMESNYKSPYKNNEHWLVGFMDMNKEVVYYFEQPRNLAPGTYNIALIKPSTELDNRMKALTAGYEIYYIEKKVDVNHYVSFNKDKMPAELSKFAYVGLGTIGSVEIDYNLRLCHY